MEGPDLPTLCLENNKTLACRVGEAQKVLEKFLLNLSIQLLQQYVTKGVNAPVNSSF